MTTLQLTNQWTAGYTIDIAATPCPVRPGEPLCVTVRGVPANAQAVWCRGEKLHRGPDTAYPLGSHAPGAWHARLPVAAHATDGPIHLVLYVRHGTGPHAAVPERHDLTAGRVDSVERDAALTLAPGTMSGRE